MALFATTDVNFSKPTELYRIETSPTAVAYNDNSGGGGVSLATTAAFTGLATQGLADTTNWATDTFKTLLSVSEAGELASYIGPTMATAGDVHTVEFTADGVVTTIAYTTANNTVRPMLCALTPIVASAFTSSGIFALSNTSPISSNKRQNRYAAASTGGLQNWDQIGFTRPPLLAWKYSFQLRAKNSVAITNSTATAFSAIVYRLKGTS